MGGGGDIGQRKLRAGQPVPSLRQMADVIEMGQDVLRGGAHQGAVRGAAAAEPFIELFPDLWTRHLGVEFLVEPGGQAASLGPPGGIEG